MRKPSVNARDPLRPAARPPERRRMPPAPPPEACEEMLRQMPPKPTSEQCRELVAALATEKWSLREKIAERLALAGPPAVPALLEMLANGLWFSRAAAVKALGRMADPRALLPVLKACKEANQTVSEEALRAAVGYCRAGMSLAVAKIVQARGPLVRADFNQRLKQVDAASAARLERLWAEKDLMGPESRLSADQEETLAQRVRDEDWGLRWAEISPSEPLQAAKGSVLERLQEMSAPAAPPEPPPAPPEEPE
ncbi:MAG: hypothetical protein GF355_02945 [Candidatus Eisenbacteria bacterium]|nr:hypothetical protein [Candidatus Eisenbacteria bacterium]